MVMRRLVLPFVLAPVLVALVSARPAHAAHAAEASAPAAKRVAKRGRALPPAVLPAPPTSLPQLPPPAYDRTATTALTNAVVTTPGLTRVSSADGQELPSLPPSSGASAAPAAPSVDAPPSDRDAAGGRKIKAPKGWVLQFGTGALVPATSFMAGGDALGPGISFDVRLGAYVTPHFGFLGGFRGSYGHKQGGCGDGCSGYSLQVPLLVQLALKDRNHGLYGELGFGFGTTYGVSGGGTTITFSTPVEFKLGTGYRINRPDSSFTADINLGMDVGKMKSADLSSGSFNGSGPIVDAPTHVVVALSLITHFSL